MSKLEQKLIELGYSPLRYEHLKYNKLLDITVWYNGLIHISLNIDKTKVVDAWVTSCVIRNEIELDYNIQAFNQLQKDLEALKEYEEKT